MAVALDHSQAFVKDLRSGSHVILDSGYGVEEVVHVEELALANGVRCAHLHVRTTEGRVRFAVRGLHEPTLLLP